MGKAGPETKADMTQGMEGHEMGGRHGLDGVKRLGAARGYGGGEGKGPGPGNTSFRAAVDCAKHQTSGTDKMGNPTMMPGAGGHKSEGPEY